MRQIGALLLGVWYSVVLSSSLTGAIRTLSGDHGDGFGDHYLLIALASITGVAIAAYFAGIASRKYPVPLSALATLPLPALYLYLLLDSGGEALNFRLPPLIFGWAPTALGFVVTLCFVIVIAGFAVGITAANHLRLSQTEDAFETIGDSQAWRILGVHWAHWYWLWIPMAFWATILIYALYSIWLGIATGWHWIVHPSLWFSWRWWVFDAFRFAFVIYPMSLLQGGVVGAWVALAEGKRQGLSTFSVAGKFLGHGVLVAILGSTICLAIGDWFLSRLPIVASHGKPWWIFF